MSRKISLLAGGIFGLFAVSLVAADSPFVGLWKLDAVKSTFATGAPKLLFATMKIEPTQKGLRISASDADGNGRAADLRTDSPLDGTASPVVGSPNVDSTSLKRVDDHTITGPSFKDGKLMYTDRRVVSADGNTLTIQRDGTTPEGIKYQNTLIFERTQSSNSE
jgi:hypothetical protein